MDPTQAQLAARLNPTPATVQTATGGLFTTGGGSTLWGQNAQGQYAAYDLAKIGSESLASKGVNMNNVYGGEKVAEGQRILKEKYGIDVGSLTRNDTFNPQQIWQSNPNAFSGKDYGAGSFDVFANDFGLKPATLTNTTVNTTANKLATPTDIATQMKDPNWVAPTVQSIQQGAANTTPQGVQIPTINLQPGSTDTASVKALQDYLVKTGYMTQAQVNTGYGTYGPQTTAAVKALQEKLGVDNSTGVGYFGPRTIAALQKNNQYSGSTTPSGITATGLSGGMGTAINLGGATGSGSSYSSGAIAAGAEATSRSIQDYINMLTPPTDAAHTKYDQLLSEINGLIPGQGGRGAAQAQAEKDAGVADIKKSLADINSQIAVKTAEYKALLTDIEGKPITMNSIIGSQAQVKRAAESELGILQATAQGLMGQLDAAQKTADRVVDLKYADVKDAIDIRMQQLQLLEGELTKSEKIRADAISMYLQDQKDKLAVTIANEKDKNATLLNLLQKYPDANISLSDTLEQAAAKVKNSRIYQQETRLASSSTSTTNNTSTNSGVITEPMPNYDPERGFDTSPQGQWKYNYDTYKWEPNNATPLTANLGKLTPTQVQTLNQAGLYNLDNNTKSFFLNTEPAFQDQFIRTVTTKGLNLSGFSSSELQDLYDEWKKSKGSGREA